MSFILIPTRGEDIQVNAWNWKPTLELLRAANLINDDMHERLGIHAAGGNVNAESTCKIADFLDAQLAAMKPGDRIRADLQISSTPKEPVLFTPGMKMEDIDAFELYSATYDWLVMFRDFCRRSDGFRVS